MKVCVVTTSFPHFKGQSLSPFIWEMCHALTQQGVHVSVVCPDVSDATDDASFSPVTVHRFRYFFKKYLLLSGGAGFLPSLRSSPLSILLFPLYLFSFVYTTFRYSRDCDLLHAQWSLAGFICVVVGKLRKKPVMLTLRGSDVHTFRKSFLLRHLFYWMVRSVSFVTANNEPMLDFVDHPHKHLVYNGVETSIFCPADKKRMRKKLLLPLAKKIVLYVGRLSEIKNPQRFVRVCQHYAQRYKNALFVVIGEGPLLDELKQNATSDFLFLGSLHSSRIHLYMQAADVLMLTSNAEGMPNVVLEALACGCPVITTDVGGVRSLIDNGKQGYVCSSEEELLTSLVSVLQKPLLARRLSRQAHQRIRDLGLSWKQCAQQYITLYKKTINTSKK